MRSWPHFRFLAAGGGGRAASRSPPPKMPRLRCPALAPARLAEVAAYLRGAAGRRVLVRRR